MIRRGFTIANSIKLSIRSFSITGLFERLHIMGAQITRKSLEFAGVLSLLLYAVYVRSFRMPGAISNPFLNITDSDAARFYRLIDLISHNYPSLPIFDSFANFPWGMKEQLPPLWAFAEASFAIAVDRFTHIGIPSAAAIFPIIMGFVLIVPAYYVGKYLLGGKAGLTVAFVALLYPTAVNLSSAGAVDHHIADLLIYMSIITYIVGSYYYYAKNKKRRALILACLAGLATAINLLISLSAILVVMIIASASLAGILLLSPKERYNAFWIGTISLASSGFIMLLLYLITPWFESKLSFSALSLFQPVALIGLAAVVSIAYAINTYLAEQKRLRWVVLLGFYVILATAMLMLPGFGEKIIQGYFRSIGHYPLGMITAQNTPIASNLLQKILAIFVILALGFFIWVRHLPIRGRFEFWRLFLLTWLAIAGLFFVNALFYGLLFAPVAIISFGLLITKPASQTEALIDMANGDKMAKSARIAWLSVTVIVAGLLIIWPAFQHKAPSDINKFAMFKWIDRHTPEVQHYYSPFQKPEYGIACDWSFGESIEVIAKRPTLTTGNHETGMNGIITWYRIFQATSESEVVSVMGKYRLRYILVNSEYAPWVGDLNRIGDSSGDPFKTAHLASKREISKQAIARLMNVRLHRFLGVSNKKYGIEPLQHFRLINAIGHTKKNASLLFECVKGAHLTIRGPRGARVIILTTIRSKLAKGTEWRLERRIGNNGSITVSLPYSTEDKHYPVKADIYQISVGDNTYHLNISARDVLRGSSILLAH